jgi:predicted kinase
LIVEATFSKRTERARLVDLARRCHADLSFVECRVSPDEAKRRLMERVTTPNVSDGRVEIYDQLARSFEPIDSGEFERLIRLDTELGEEQQRKALRSLTTD